MNMSLYDNDGELASNRLQRWPEGISI